MKLLPLAQLQLVLQVAQELIRTGQVMEILSADMFLVVEFLQSEERATRAQPALFTAVHPLQALHQELDVADASAIELDVDGVPRLPHRYRLLAASVDPLPRLQSGLHSRKIHVWTVHIRLHC